MDCGEPLDKVADVSITSKPGLEMDVLRAMEVFVRVVDTGSLTAAAARCEMSATMVGNYIQALEKRLGVTLLQRTTRRQHLTEFGSAYYERCLEILGSVADLEAMALDTLGTPRGRLRITAPATFGTECLLPAMKEYLDRYPSVDVDVVLSDAVVDLVENGFEVAIRLGTLPDSGLIARPLAPYRMTICAAPEYLARRGTPRVAADLTEHECLAFAYSPSSEWHDAGVKWRTKGPEGSITIDVKGRVRVDSAQALRRAAVAGMGIVMLPIVLLQEEIEAGRLVPILTQYELPSRPLHVVYLPDRRISPKVRSFVEFMIERFGARQRNMRQSPAA
jgi:DNA-binding transcriptional LysR family regulator